MVFKLQQKNTTVSAAQKERVDYQISTYFNPATLQSLPTNTTLSSVALRGENTGGETEKGAFAATVNSNPSQHTVVIGDTLNGIAAKYNLKPASIALANPNVKDIELIQLGDTLHIPSKDASDEEIQKAQAARRPKSSLMAYADSPSVFNTPTSSPVASSTETFHYPSPATTYISQPFIPRVHSGVDLAFPEDTPIIASKSGTVSTASYGWNGGYGIMIVLDHGDGWTTLYGHLSRLSVTRGQYIAQGTLLGYSGNTGHSTGPHLHFEIRNNAQALNPLNYLK